MKEQTETECENVTPKEIMETYQVAIVRGKNLTPSEKQALITFTKMVNNEVVESCKIVDLYKLLLLTAFQRNFLLIISSLILALTQIEAYELLGRIQKTISKIAAHKTLSSKSFWDLLPIKPQHTIPVVTKQNKVGV